MLVDDSLVSPYPGMTLESYLPPGASRRRALESRSLTWKFQLHPFRKGVDFALGTQLPLVEIRKDQPNKKSKDCFF